MVLLLKLPNYDGLSVGLRIHGVVRARTKRKAMEGVNCHTQVTGNKYFILSVT